MRLKINKTILNTNEFIATNFSKEFIHSLAHHIDFKTITHENNVELENSDDFMLYYVENGLI